VAAGVTGYAFTAMSTPLGELTIVVSDVGVIATTFSDDDAVPELDPLETRLASPIRRLAARASTPVRREVDAYFRGTGRTFATPVDLSLVPEGFRRRVLEATIAIPYGELVTYGDVAAAAGSRRAGRAAGGALSHCPIELFVPCHRVVHAGGTIGGYGRHEDRKRWLLRHEGAI
jgi:methylated-DNA-[protein]-cysteine S-methyltransferase